MGVSGSEGGSESSTPSKPVATPTRSTTSQSVASEVAQVIQTKVAFKQVSPTALHRSFTLSLPLHFATHNLANNDSNTLAILIRVIDLC